MEKNNNPTDAAKFQADKSEGKKKEKKQVKVINVPKKKKLLRTPSHILRICLIWCFLINLFLLTYPFLEVKLYINDKLEITPNIQEANFRLATQNEIDYAAYNISVAYSKLEKLPDAESSESSDESKQESNNDSSEAASDLSDSTSPVVTDDEEEVRSIDTAKYEWQYRIDKNVDASTLLTMIETTKNIKRYQYTEKSVEVLNHAVLQAQRTLGASVNISQNALQMMLGGSVSEAFGRYDSVGNSIWHGLTSFALAVIPILGFFFAVFDKKRHFKHVIITLGTLLALADIFLTIYPYVGIGAVLSIIMYIIISVLNISSIYAKQQEDYIMKHPEKEAEFSEKHPQFVKALINKKSVDSKTGKPDAKELTYKAAKNAQKHNQKKKKSK